jgi:hypothetical protein
MVTTMTSSVVEKQKLQIVKLTQKSLKSRKRIYNLIPLFKVLQMSVGIVPNSEI